MTQAATVLGIIASFLGLIAAAVTLLFGGAASAFGTSRADTVLNLGWGGVFFSLAALVASMLIHTKPRGAGFSLTVIAILGAVLGGTLVAVCMALALVASIMAILSGRTRMQPNGGVNSIDSTLLMSQPQKRSSLMKWILGGAVVMVSGLLVIGILMPSDSRKASANDIQPKSGSVAELESAEVSDLKPTGDLAAILELGGDHTAVQRENTFQAVKGKVVVWDLPVYDVKRKDDSYNVVTQSHFPSIFGASPIVATRLTITPRNESERLQLEALKTGQLIRFKGRITGISMRRIEINPAIVWAATPLTSGATAATSDINVHDIDSLIKPFLKDCKAGNQQKAIQFGGMGIEEAAQHANETCSENLATFQECITKTTSGADACAEKANPTSE